MMAQTHFLALSIAVLAGRCAGSDDHGSHIQTLWGGAGTSLCIGAAVEEPDEPGDDFDPNVDPEEPQGDLDVYLEQCTNVDNLLILYPVPPDNGGPISDATTGNIPWGKNQCVIEGDGPEDPVFEVDEAVLVSHGTNHIVTKWVNTLIAQNGVDDFLGRLSIAEAFQITTSPTLQLFYGSKSWFLNDNNLDHVGQDDYYGGEDYAYSQYGPGCGYFYNATYYYNSYGYESEYYYSSDPNTGDHHHEDGGTGHEEEGNAANFTVGDNSSGHDNWSVEGNETYYYGYSAYAYSAACGYGYYGNNSYGYYYGAGSSTSSQPQQDDDDGGNDRRLQNGGFGSKRTGQAGTFDSSAPQAPRFGKDWSRPDTGAPAVSLRGLFPAPPRLLVLGDCDSDAAWFTFVQGLEGTRIQAASGNFLARKGGGLSDGTKVVTLHDSNNDYWQYNFEAIEDLVQKNRRLEREESGETIHV